VVLLEPTLTQTGPQALSVLESGLAAAVVAAADTPRVVPAVRVLVMAQRLVRLRAGLVTLIAAAAAVAACGSLVTEVPVVLAL
jgi:hypothetical protein